MPASNVVLNLTEVFFFFFLFFPCVTPVYLGTMIFFFLIPLTHMTKHLVGNVFFMFNYPVVCQEETKLSLASSCMMERRKELGLCSQTDLGLNLTATPAV